MFACEKAVSLAPDYGDFIDSRGLARALTGDTQGAIEDFKKFIEWEQGHASGKRRIWVESLEQGKNPFTPEVLESLRNE
ncbi:MAG: hypothetical protein F6K04_25045 [Leptolyngbya sp. SIO4C5]|nr:hypothetical protein [Leptolyngbya sp. SIO4C5]